MQKFENIPLKTLSSSLLSKILEILSCVFLSFSAMISSSSTFIFIPSISLYATFRYFMCSSCETPGELSLIATFKTF